MGKTFLSIFRAVVAVSTTRQIESAGVGFVVKNTGFLFPRFIKMGCSTSKTEFEIQNDENYVEEVVCKTGDIRENEMKSLDLGEGKILLVKQNGKLSAVGAKCTHYGAPLSTGALGNGRVRCPWHGACFNITTGDIEDFPEFCATEVISNYKGVVEATEKLLPFSAYKKIFTHSEFGLLKQLCK